MMTEKHIAWQIGPGLPEILYQCPYKTVLVLTLVWRLKKNLPNYQI